MTDIGPLATEALGTEALKPMVFGPTDPPPVAPPAEQPRRPGRPPGARNRYPRQVIDQGGAGAKLVTPPTRPDKPTPDKPTKVPPTKEHIEELTGKIVIEFNDNLMSILGMIGLPDGMLYKEGQGPAKKVDVDPRYTAYAAQVVLSPNQAKGYAKLLANLEQTEWGKKITGEGGSGNLPIIISGAIAVASSFNYLKGLNRFIKQMPEAIAEYNQFVMDRDAARERGEQL